MPKETVKQKKKTQNRLSITVINGTGKSQTVEMILKRYKFLAKEYHERIPVICHITLIWKELKHRSHWADHTRLGANGTDHIM